MYINNAIQLNKILCKYVYSHGKMRLPWGICYSWKVGQISCGNPKTPLCINLLRLLGSKPAHYCLNTAVIHQIGFVFYRNAFISCLHYANTISMKSIFAYSTIPNIRDVPHSYSTPFTARVRTLLVFNQLVPQFLFWQNIVAVRFSPVANSRLKWQTSKKALWQYRDRRYPILVLVLPYLKPVYWR